MKGELTLNGDEMREIIKSYMEGKLRYHETGTRITDIDTYYGGLRVRFTDEPEAAQEER